VILDLIFGSLTLLSLALTLWQWRAGRRFPLHQRPRCSGSEGQKTGAADPGPAVSLLKPVKGCDVATEDCLRSWFTQVYSGPVQILFGVADAGDPVCGVVEKLLRDFPNFDAELVVCGPPAGANAKISQLAKLEQRTKHELVVISDADVRVPPDLLTHLLPPLREPAPTSRQPSVTGGTGLMCCFYRLANPSTLAMEWEAVAVNADFWSRVLQSRELKPMDFALGAVMATRRQLLRDIGGFAALADYLADDYQLGQGIARRGWRIGLSTIVVECWSSPMGWREAWNHQLRWLRTIRVCQPVPFFFSLVSNSTLWPVLWLALSPGLPAAVGATVCCLFRIFSALDLQRRINRVAVPAAPVGWRYAWLIPVNDLLQAVLWLLAFLGNRIVWRGQHYRLRSDGTLTRD
jgi:ceramide glucosyltransferase